MYNITDIKIIYDNIIDCTLLCFYHVYIDLFWSSHWRIQTNNPKTSINFEYELTEAKMRTKLSFGQIPDAQT